MTGEATQIRFCQGHVGKSAEGDFEMIEDK